MRQCAQLCSYHSMQGPHTVSRCTSMLAMSCGVHAARTVSPAHALLAHSLACFPACARTLAAHTIDQSHVHACCAALHTLHTSAHACSVTWCTHMHSQCPSMPAPVPHSRSQYGRSTPVQAISRMPHALTAPSCPACAITWSTLACLHQFPALARVPAPIRASSVPVQPVPDPPCTQIPHPGSPACFPCMNCSICSSCPRQKSVHTTCPTVFPHFHTNALPPLVASPQPSPGPAMHAVPWINAPLHALSNAAPHVPIKIIQTPLFGE